MRGPGIERHCDNLAKTGFSVLEEVISPGQVAEIRRSVMEVAAAEAEQKKAWVSNGNQRVFALLNKGDSFRWLATHDAVLAIVEQVLTSWVLLSSITAHIVLPGNSPQGLHADQDYVWSPWARPVVMNAVWALDDFAEENGGTVIYPRTHLAGDHPVTPVPENYQRQVVSVPAGSVILIDGRVWHGSGKSVAPSGARVGILSCYCAPFIRQQENIFRSLRTDVRSTLNDRERRLLGYDVWQGLGVVGGLPPEWAGQVGERSGPTNADGIFG